MKESKSAFIAIVGRPNVGKSSILNSILPYKVCAVSGKPQTTRTRIMGVYNEDETQIVFIDTPGFHKPHNKLGENMVKAVKGGLADIDVVFFVVDAAPKFKFNEEKLPPAEVALLDSIRERKVPVILVLNKIDLLPDKTALINMIIAYNSYYNFDAVVPVSALEKDGIDILIDEAKKYTKESIHFFDDDSFTDQPEKVIVAEMIREKLLNNLQDEIPHGVAVCLERFFERDMRNGEPIIEVDATIYCERQSHKGVIIGKKGAMLKNIGTLARKDIEEFFGCKVALKLWVKVKEGWRNSEVNIKNFGLSSN